MAPRSRNRELAFTLNDVGRLLNTFADQKAREHGMTRAKWVVLARLDDSEGMKQNELAEMLDLQPITLTRLLDGLAENGLIERRACPDDRRAKRLYLTPAARPVLQKMSHLGETLMGTVLQGLSADDIAQLIGTLSKIKENLREAVQRKPALEQSYG